MSAGIDITLGFISDIHGEETALNICNLIEYIWNKEKYNDPFTVN